MREVTLVEVYTHPIAQKYLQRSGVVHAVACAYHAFKLAKKNNVSIDLATKGALLHDMGHYSWYRNGKWDYNLYKQNDIHAIKGAERAHKLLIRLGENPIYAKDISLAILFHTDSYMPEASIKRTPLQQVVKCADELDEEEGGNHHYRKLAEDKLLQSIVRLDKLVEDNI
jgi:uncharacterized protein